MRRKCSSPVASNCSSAEPYWKPCVHSVHPRAVYRPATVNTGEPRSGVQVCSMESIFAALTCQSRSILGSRSPAVSFLLTSTGAPYPKVKALS